MIKAMEVHVRDLQDQIAWAYAAAARKEGQAARRTRYDRAGIGWRDSSA
jgi:hypothetical protein